ncbi:MAG: leucine-rich repeat protein [Alistipes timonensis]|nr:leucine-rich repeat protein [Alistipes timonensis]
MNNLHKLLVAAAFVTAAVGASAEDSPVWKAVSASDNTTYAIKQDGTLWAWGDNEEGQLGTGGTSVKCSSTPLQMGDASDWKAAYGARGAGFFLKNDGTLWTVGSNEFGMSGVGDGVTKHTSLTQVGTDTDWAEVYTSISWSYTVLATKTDGSLWAWGYGSTFCLGQGDTNNSAVPVRVGTDNDWKSVSVGSSHVLALKNDGSLWGWGFASYHQLMNAESNIKVPTRIGTDTWKAVYAIDNASFGVKTDGTFWAWGDNTRNLLGLNSPMDDTDADGSLANVQTPQQVTLIPAEVTRMSGCESVRVVEAGGKVYAWGANANGGLGNGKGSAYEADGNQWSYVPVEVSLEAGVVPAALTSGQRFSAVLAQDGVIYGWGSNRWGQMGNYADDTKLTFCASPIVMGVPAPPEPGEYTFDAANIPSSLADAVKIKLTGEWNSAAFMKLCQAIGANIGLPPVGNKTLVSVDMSEATIAPNTSLYGQVGLSSAGVFKMCKALEAVKFPANETAANIVSLQEAFMNCENLKSCDVSALTGVTNINDAFYNTKIAMVNMAAWTGVTKSEDAFGKCSALNSVVLPANFTCGKFLFNSCSALRLIDWSSYAGETAPVIAADANIFQDLTEEQQGQIIMMVPEAVFESFKADATWAYVNLQAVREQEEGVYYVDALSVPENLKDARVLYLSGRWESSNFKALSDALGNNSGTTGNLVLELVDMSQAEIAVGANFNAEFPGALWGTVTKGVFQACKALTTVVMPAAEQAANIRSFKNAFYGCEALTSIDLSGCTGLTTTEDAFYGDNALTDVVLPANFAFASGTFDRCNSLTKIDWTLFEGTAAPAFKANSLPSRGKELTIVVPEAAYDSFISDANWAGYNIISPTTSGVGSVGSDDASMVPADVYDLMGRKVATVAPAEAASVLPAGIYVIKGRKVLVK